MKLVNGVSSEDERVNGFFASALNSDSNWHQLVP
jgi:hypothetical protein